MRRCLFVTMILAGCQENKPASTPSASNPAKTSAVDSPALRTPANRAEALGAIEKMGGRIGDKTSFGQPGLRVDLSRTGIQDRDLPQLVLNLQTVPDLTELSLVGTAVSAKGLAELKTLKTLKLLVLSEDRLATKTVGEAIGKLQEANPNLAVLGKEIEKGNQP